MQKTLLSWGRDSPSKDVTISCVSAYAKTSRFLHVVVVKGAQARQPATDTFVDFLAQKFQVLKGKRKGSQMQSFTPI
jgi:hypothetical protein